MRSTPAKHLGDVACGGRGRGSPQRNFAKPAVSKTRPSQRTNACKPAPRAMQSKITCMSFMSFAMCQTSLFSLAGGRPRAGSDVQSAVCPFSSPAAFSQSTATPFHGVPYRAIRVPSFCPATRDSKNHFPIPPSEPNAYFSTNPYIQRRMSRKMEIKPSRLPSLAGFYLADPTSQNAMFGMLLLNGSSEIARASIPPIR
jgi:hypothetical protein